VRLLSPLAQDVREYRLAIGRPPASTLLLDGESGEPWDKTAWQMWRADRWTPACRATGLDPIPRPYDLRHSFASLLLAEGRQPLYVARQLGHSLPVLFSTYAHLIDEYAERSQPASGGRGRDRQRADDLMCVRSASWRLLTPRFQFLTKTKSLTLAGFPVNTATGIRTRVSAVRGRRPSPLDDSGER
jgi:hypothetical protein